ncbi:hypothetical protein [Streptomyces sp. NPDC019507]|uniref:hypothetical protein n=1 Tax=Streptomyces sp. NPDC019507 TaxID=3154689 RepID=UPI0033C310A9
MRVHRSGAGAAPVGHGTGGDRTGTGADRPGHSGVAHGAADVHASYGEGLFLVRPGGCVGWAGEEAAGLADWLDQVMRC